MRFARSFPNFTTRWLHLKSCIRCCCTERPVAAVCRPDTKVNSAERTAGSNKHQPLVRLIAVVYARPLQPMRPGRRRLRDDAPGKYAWLAVRVRIRTRVRAIGCRVCSRGVGKCADLWHSPTRSALVRPSRSASPRRRESLCDGLL